MAISGHATGKIKSASTLGKARIHSPYNPEANQKGAEIHGKSIPSREMNLSGPNCFVKWHAYGVCKYGRYISLDVLFDFWTPTQRECINPKTSQRKNLGTGHVQ